MILFSIMDAILIVLNATQIIYAAIIRMAQLRGGVDLGV